MCVFVDNTLMDDEVLIEFSRLYFLFLFCLYPCITSYETPSVLSKHLFSECFKLSSKYVT